MMFFHFLWNETVELCLAWLPIQIGENCDFTEVKSEANEHEKNTEISALWTVFKYLSLQLIECVVVWIM